MKNFEAFNQVNENLKSFITDYQLTKKFDKDKFIELHNQLSYSLDNNKLYEDLFIYLKNAINQILDGNLDYLIKEEYSYHNILWKLHQRIISFQKHISLKDLSKEFKKFNEILKTKKFFLKDKENNIYYIITTIGSAIGHISTIKIDKNIRLEYNDHSPSRIYLIKKLLEKENFGCSEIKILKNIFPKKETSDNLFFIAEKKKEDNDLQKLAEIMEACIDIDWILLDAKKPYTQEELNNEIKLLEGIYVLYEVYKIKPKKIIKKINETIVKNCLN